MESGLTPRQIQERIRAGQSLDEVAAIAGMPRDRVERFAFAVLDERRHLAEQARSHSVRREGEAGSHRTLGAVAEKYFAEHDIDSAAIEWDATRGEDRHFWTVTVTWQTEQDQRRSASFGYDVRGAFSVPEDDAALEIVGATADTDQLVDEESDDNEPTLNYADQFAIVNAVQEDSDDEDPIEVGSAGPFSLQDIVPSPESELDALYAMLRGHQEDSVNIYAGLAESQQPPPPAKTRRRRRNEQVEEKPDEAEAPTPPESTEQEPLLEAEAAPEAPRPKKRTRKRAAVPTWDEIMFGGPDPD